MIRSAPSCTFLLLLAFLCLGAPLFAQRSYLGFGAGIGGGEGFSKGSLVSIPPVSILRGPFAASTNFPGFYSGELEYRSIPSGSESLSLEKGVGLEYAYNSYSHDDRFRLGLHALRVHSMLGFHWGNRDRKWKLVPALGLYWSFPFDHSVSGEEEEFNGVRTTSFGLKWQLDLRYRPSSNMTLLLAWETYNGLTPTYDETAYLASGQPIGGHPLLTLDAALRLKILYSLRSLFGEGSEESEE